MTDEASSTRRQVAYSGAEAETSFGFAQAVRAGGVIYVSGQAGLDRDGELVAPAAMDRGEPTSFVPAMEAQMRAAYACAVQVLAQYGATLSDVVQETLFVLDVPAAFAVGGVVRKAAYGKERPQVASNLIGTPRLALPGQLIEIAFTAVVPS